MDKEGQFRCGSTGAPSNRDLSDRPYFREALQGHDLVVGEFTLGRISDKPVLPIAIAMRDQNKAVIGIAAASIDLVWLGEQLKERGLPKEGSITVADRKGTILARQPLPEEFVGKPIPPNFLRLVNAPSPGFEEVVSQDGTRRILGYMPVSEPPKGLYVSAGLSSEASYGAVVRTAWTGFLLVALAGLGTLAVTWFLGERLFVRPIRLVTRVMQRWREGDASARSGLDARHGEIGELGAEFDRLIDELTESQEQRDLLAGELIHRNKNTLATVLAIASATMNKPQAARDVLPDFLARVSALGATQEVLTSKVWATTELQPLIEKVVAPLVVDHARRVTCSGPVVELPAQQALGMTMVIHELCTNALKYGSLTAAEGRVEVVWMSTPAVKGEELTLTWKERGGHPLTPPTGKAGFGTRLIARAFGAAGSATTTFNPDGLVCRVTLILDNRGPDGPDAAL
jgi:two-component sensor histidine kinase